MTRFTVSDYDMIKIERLADGHGSYFALLGSFVAFFKIRWATEYVARRAGSHFARERGALLKYRGRGWLDDVAA